MNINIYLMQKGELLPPSSWDFLVLLHLPNIFLIPFGIREFLHLKCGKSEFLHIFTGLFKSKNVMVCVLPRLLKKGQTLKRSYCTLKNKQQSILQPSLGEVPVWRATAKRDLRLSKYSVEVFPLTVEFEGHLPSGVPFPAVNVVKHGQPEWIMMTSCHLTTKTGSCIIKKCLKLERGTSENFPKFVWPFFFFGDRLHGRWLNEMSQYESL